MSETSLHDTGMPAIDPARGCGVTIGNFDGVHLGHRTLIERIIGFCRKVGMPCVVITFHPHPRLLLGMEHTPLMTREDRLSTIASLNPDFIWEIPFTRRLAGMTHEEFIRRHLAPLQMRRLLIGHDFSLGKDRRGQFVDLQNLGRAFNYTVEQLAPVLQDGAVVSSSRIRHLVEQGGVDLAARMLGRPHFCVGTVRHGDGRGAGLGFPTANLDLPETLLPPSGVYVSRTEREDGVMHDSITNIGRRPTFEGTGTRIETFLLDMPEGADLYNRTLRIHFIVRLRSERRFPDAEALKAQIAEDVARARDMLGGASRQG